MAEIITVASDTTFCGDASLHDYINVLNGLSYDCQNGGYREGYRNEMALDLTVSSYMLGLDASDVLRKFEKHGLIDAHNDDEDPADRVKRALNYDYRFNWDYMISQGFYADLGDKHLDDILYLKFVLE